MPWSDLSRLPEHLQGSHASFFLLPYLHTPNPWKETSQLTATVSISRNFTLSIILWSRENRRALFACCWDLLSGQSLPFLSPLFLYPVPSRSVPCYFCTHLLQLARPWEGLFPLGVQSKTSHRGLHLHLSLINPFCGLGFQHTHVCTPSFSFATGEEMRLAWDTVPSPPPALACPSEHSPNSNFPQVSVIIIPRLWGGLLHHLEWSPPVAFTQCLVFQCNNVF